MSGVDVVGDVNHYSMYGLVVSEATSGAFNFFDSVGVFACLVVSNRIESYAASKIICCNLLGLQNVAVFVKKLELELAIAVAISEVSNSLLDIEGYRSWFGFILIFNGASKAISFDAVNGGSEVTLMIVGKGYGDSDAIWILVGKTSAMSVLGFILANYVIECLIAVFSGVGNDSIEVYDFTILERNGSNLLFFISVKIVKIKCKCIAVRPIAASKNLACANCDGASGFVGIDNCRLIAGKGWFAINN